MPEKGALHSLTVVTKKLGPSYTGATYATFELIRRWRKAGLRLQIFYMMRDKDGASLKEIDSFRFGGRRELRALVRERGEGTLIYSDDHLSGWLASMKVPYVHTYHGNWPDARYLDWYHMLKSFYFIPLYTKGVRNAAAVVNVSRYFQERFSLPLNRDCRIIHNGINFRESDEATADPGERDGIIMVGNVDARKFNKALPLLRALPDVAVHIYGKISEPAVAARLEALPNVTLMGFQKGIPFSRYKLFLSSSGAENLSIAVCEAILAGLPVLGYEVGGLSEVVRDGVNGVLFPRGDERGLLDAVRGILKGRALPMDHSLIDDFDWEISAASYLNLFKEKGLTL